MELKNFEESLYPPSVAMLPGVVLARNLQIINKYGLDTFLKRREFQRAQEMYQTACYAIGMTARTNKLYWVAPGKKNETPDTYIIDINDRTNIINAECVEIALWEEHTNHMIEIIEKKLLKSYPSNFVILIHAEKPKHIESKYFQDIHKRLKEYKISAGAVRLLITGINNKGGKDILIGEVYPSNRYTECQSANILERYQSFKPMFNLDIISGRAHIIPKQEDMEVKLPELLELRN